MAADFNKPVLTDNYVDVLAMLRDNQAVLARMFATGTVATNIPVGSVRFDSGKFQTWDGAAWVDVPVSLDGGGTGSQSASAARVALGTNDAENLTTGVMSADRVPGLDAAKIVSGTLTRDTSGNAATATVAASCSGNAATATYATSAGSATSAGYASSAGNVAWSNVTSKALSWGAVQITDYLSALEGEVNWTAPENTVVVGEYSLFNTISKDRLLKLRYRSLGV